TKRVARAEPAGFDSEISSLFENGVPKFHRIAFAKENFYAVFTSITGPRHQDRHFIQLKIDNVIARRQVYKKLADARTLNWNSAKMSAAIAETNIARTMSIQPCELFICARRIHHQQKFRVADSIRDQVFNYPAAFVQQKRVLALADIQLVDVVGQHCVKPISRL